MAKNVKLMKSNGEIFNDTLSIETSWNNIKGKPTNFVPTAHNHNAEDITTTDNKQFVSSAEKSNWNAKETTTGAQAKANSALDSAKTYAETQASNALTSAKGYTDTEVGAVQNDLNAFKNQKGVSGGLAELDEEGHVPSSQLPSYVDDVLSYSTLNDFPTTGESGKIYVTKDTNKTYRWDGTNNYVEISKSLALGETTSTAYAGNKGALNKTRIDNIMDGTVTVDRAKKDGEGLQIRGNYVRKSELYTEGVIKEDLIPLKSLPSLVFQISSPQDNIIYDGTDTVLLDLYNDFANKADKSHPHDAGDINSGVFHEEAIPNLDASKITTGTFGTSRIPSLPASKINSGELSTQRIPNLPISKIEDLGNTLSAMATAVAGKSEKGHEHSQYLTDAPTTGSEYVRKSGAWVVSSAGSENDSRISADDILHWNLAYGWGNHANEGYLKSAPNTYITSGNYSTPPPGKRWVSTSYVSSPTYSVGTTAEEPDSNVLPSPSGLSAGTTGYVYTQSLPMQEAYYIVQEVGESEGLITLRRNDNRQVSFTIPKPGEGGATENNYVTRITGSGNSTIRLERAGLSDLTLSLTHSHGSLIQSNDIPNNQVLDKISVSSGIVQSFSFRTMTPAHIGAAPASHTHNYVPTSRTVNGKALSSNISLSASDVSAVPTTRTIAGRALSSNITASQLKSDLSVPTTLDDLIVAGEGQIAVRGGVDWIATDTAPNTTRWGGYRIRVGSYSSGTSNYITFGI